MCSSLYKTTHNFVHMILALGKTYLSNPPLLPLSLRKYNFSYETCHGDVVTANG